MSYKKQFIWRKAINLSARELDTQLIIALKVELARKDYIDSVIKDVDEIQRLLVSSINKLK